MAQVGPAASELRQVAHVFDSKNLNPATRKNHAYPEDFMLFWKLYPLHKDKRKAAQAWRNAIRETDATTILNAAKKYRDDPNRVDGYTKYPASWLNAGAWDDEDPIPVRLASGIQPAAPDPHAWEADAEEFVRGTRWEKP